MKKFEYKEFTLLPDTLFEQLNKEGDKGWQMVFGSDKVNGVILMREKE